MGQNLVGPVLNQWLEREGLPKTELAKRLGCDASTITRYVKGERTPSVDMCDHLATVTDIPLVSWVLLAAGIEPRWVIEEITNEILWHVLTATSEGFTRGMSTRTIILDTERSSHDGHHR